MYKISDKVIRFITKTRKNFNKRENPKKHLSQLLVLIAMMSLNYLHRKYTGGQKSRKINPFMYMDDIKLFTKNEKELETDRNDQICSQDIEMIFHKEKCAMLIKKSGKLRRK